MGETEDRGPGGRPLYTWQFYLFGMVVGALVFTLIVQYLIGPGWGNRFFRGWVDPALNLVVTPLAGAILGFSLVAISNVLSAASRKKG